MALLAAVAVSAAACGGDDVPAQRRSFVRSATAVCQAGQRVIAAETKRRFAGDREPPPEQIARFARQILIPQLSDRLAALRRLPPPRGDTERVRAWLDALARDLARVSGDPGLVGHEGGPDPFKDSNRRARDLGARACVS